MKKRFSLMWRIATTLVLVLSLGLVMAAPVSADVSPATVTNAPQAVGTAATYTVAFTTTAGLLSSVGTITITFPSDTFVPDGVIAGSTVKVSGTACTTVTGVTATGVVTITVPKDIPAGAVTVVIDKTAGVLNPTTVKTTWKLTVKTSEEVLLVSSAPYSTVGVPNLTVDITSPLDTGSVSVGQVFTVTAVVINTGTGPATSVTATILITGSATLTSGATPQSLADLAVGGSATATWTATCTAVGAVTIKVTPSGKYTDAGTPIAIPSGNLTFDQIGVTQQLAAALAVTFVTPSSLTVKVGDTFTVTATVKNTGVATATSVTATIAVTGPATAIAPLTKTVADITAGASATTTAWTVTCTGVGTVTINVTPAGKDANTGAAIASLTPKTATVTQTEAAILKVTIIAPLDGAQFFVGTVFSVTATVQNTGASTAKDVTLTVDPGTNAIVKAGQVNPQTVGYLAPGATSTNTWLLVCTAPGLTTITVTPAGTDVLNGPITAVIPGSVTVLQLGMTFDIPLTGGWNLISLPLIPIDPNIGTVLAGITPGVKVNKVAYYTGGPAGSWQYYSPGAPSDLTQMKDGKGYWIDVSADGDLSGIGYDLALPGQLPPTYDLVAGWNLIGYTVAVGPPKLAGDYLGPAVGPTLSAMYIYFGGFYIPVQKIDPMSPGLGYWLAVNAAGKIYP